MKLKINIGNFIIFQFSLQEQREEFLVYLEYHSQRTTTLSPVAHQSPFSLLNLLHWLLFIFASLSLTFPFNRQEPGLRFLGINITLLIFILCCFCKFRLSSHIFQEVYSNGLIKWFIGYLSMSQSEFYQINHPKCQPFQKSLFNFSSIFFFSFLIFLIILSPTLLKLPLLSKFFLWYHNSFSFIIKSA